MLEKKRKLYLDSMIEEFEELTKDAGKVQRETLKRILEENGEAEYLQGWGLGNRTDIQSFKACVPIVTHKELEPYIQIIADGDQSLILTGKPITSISLRYIYIYFFDIGYGTSTSSRIEEADFGKFLLNFCSSGTTQGKPKFVPFNEELVQSTMQIYRTSFAFRNRFGSCLL